MTILYLHGFASAGNGAKAQALRARFGQDAVLSPDLPVDPRLVAEQGDALLRSGVAPPTVLVGTSLGGFYAAWFSQRWRLPCVLVNPSLSPSQTVGRRIGAHRNLVTGAPFEVLPEFADAWRRMEDEVAARLDGDLASLFLAQDDDVLPYAATLQRVPHRAFRCVTPDGGHRYEMHWDQVMDRLEAVLRGRDTS